MPIISTKEGTAINSDHVVQFTRLRNGQTRFLLSTGGEVTAEAYREDMDDLFVPVLPAQPGFVAVFVDRLSDGTLHYRHRSVIAWRLCASGNYPIFEGYHEDADDYAVVIDPAGGVFDSDHNMWATLEEWRKEYEAEQSEIAASVVKAA
ncbi:hypothetical protein [Shinella sp. M31]|uniref:hypothetical protein n=1 Tax=Shinella sp. M31 TaxID=3368615 RepID=UPI003B9E3213